MVSEEADPATAERGVFNPLYCKPCLFRPDRITAVDVAPGSHDATFTGEVVVAEPDDLILRHYRYLGREHTWSRFKELDAKRRAGDKARGFGAQYALDREQFDQMFDRALTEAAPLPF
jgi:hypothetical protein